MAGARRPLLPGAIDHRRDPRPLTLTLVQARECLRCFALRQSNSARCCAGVEATDRQLPQTAGLQQAGGQPAAQLPERHVLTCRGRPLSLRPPLATLYNPRVPRMLRFSAQRRQRHWAYTWRAGVPAVVQSSPTNGPAWFIGAHIHTLPTKGARYGCNGLVLAETSATRPLLPAFQPLLRPGLRCAQLMGPTVRHGAQPATGFEAGRRPAMAAAAAATCSHGTLQHQRGNSTSSRSQGRSAATDRGAAHSAAAHA